MRGALPVTSQSIVAQMRDRLHRTNDAVFVWLLLAEGVIGLALLFGTADARRALAMALASNAVALAAIALRRASRLSRHAVATSQALWCVLALALLDGHDGTVLCVFGMLALVALYQDWRLPLTSALAFAVASVVAVDVSQAASWFAWVALEAAALALVCARNASAMEDAANREATLQQTALTVQRKVENRTRALAAAAERYRALVENTEAIPFEYDMDDHRVVYIAPQGLRLFECTEAEVHEVGFFVALAHPDDRAHAVDAFGQFMRGERSASDPIDFRLITKSHGIIHVRTFLSHCVGSRVRGITLDTTRQTVLEHELRQAQKLESVGRLAAGVAHEINTPIQFVGDSLLFVHESVAGLFEVIAAQRAALGVDTPANRAALADAIERADLEFLEGEMPVAIQRALDGIERVGAIVRTMTSFAHPDQGRILDCDLRQPIDNALTMARNEYKYVADVVTSFGDLPRVRCRTGEINQAVLNIVVNAAHAIAEAVAGTQRRGTITVALRRDGDSAVISIGDTGVGIPAHAREHVFEPFYTTKPVGKGTGQGLALARAIVVERHGGSITFDTEVGAGTTFHLRIPLEHPGTRAAAA